MNNELKPINEELEPIDEAIKKVNEALKMDEELKPVSEDIKENENSFDKELDFIKDAVEENVEKDQFASNFPDWDLLPTNQVIRRVTRK